MDYGYGQGGSGGGIYNADGDLTLLRSTVSNNATADGASGYYGSPSGDGGGIAHHGGDLSISGSTVSGNSIGDSGSQREGANGGGVFAEGTSLTIANSSISDNFAGRAGSNSGDAGGSGGGLFIASGDTTIANSRITGNGAGVGGSGSGFYGDGGSGGSGGGIFNSGGNLFITTSTIRSNSAGRGGYGYDGGAGGHGGGVSHHGGDLSIIDTTVSSNVAGDGGQSSNGDGAQGGNAGGVDHQAGELTVLRSTISGNSAGNGSNYEFWGVDAGDGGIAGGILGGGISVSISQSTIVGNSAGLGADKTPNGLDGDNGGIFLSTLTSSIITGSIVAQNFVGDYYGDRPDIGYSNSTSLTLTSSLIGDNSGTSLVEAPVGSPDANGNLIGDPNGSGIINPLLDVLADNSGPTFTHALLPGSPAINAGDLGFTPPPDYDQRGIPFDRVYGGRIDIGAYEAQPLRADFDGDHDVDGRDYLILQIGYGTPAPNATKGDGDADGDGDVDHDDLKIWEAEYGLTELPEAPSLIVTTEQDVVDDYDLLTSLREAIEYANGLAGADTIEFDASLTGKTILLTQGELAITDELTINGLGAELLTIDASGNDPTPDANNLDGSGIFNVSDSTEINGLTLTGGDQSNGGAIYSNSSELTVRDSVITGNHSNNFKGSLQQTYGKVILERVQFLENTSPGALGLASADADITDSEFLDNEGTGILGTFYTGQVTITDSVLTGNGSPSNTWAGAISIGGYPTSTLSITNTTISGNESANVGAISAFGANVSIVDSVISGNMGTDEAVRVASAPFFSASGYYRGNLDLIGSSIIDNSGNGVTLVSQGRFHIIESTISGNSGTGVDFNYQEGTTQNDLDSKIVDSRIVDNVRGVEFGGDNGQTLSVEGSEISGNLGGGGILQRYGPVALINSTVSGNTTDGDGGGIANEDDAFPVEVSHSTITGNSADGNGGGIFGSFVLDHTIVAGNTDVDGNPDLQPDGESLAADYSIIGDSTGLTVGELADINAGTGNQLDVDPMLDVLADNGGPTFTHALLPGSPAIDAGDPLSEAGVDDVPLYDQRGVGFTRVADGDVPEDIAIDIGAFEVQAPPLQSSLQSAVQSPAPQPLSNAQLVDLALAAKLLNAEFGLRNADGPRTEVVSAEVREEVFALLAESPRAYENAAVVSAGEHELDFPQNLPERDLAHQRLQSLEDVPLSGEFFPDF